MSRFVSVIALVFAAASVALVADEKSRLTEEVQEALVRFYEEDPSLEEEIGKAPGYALFPRVGKGGLGLGAARGTGQVVEGGQPVGRTTLTQVSIGFQLGGQVYSELIIFENRETLENFKEGNFEMAAQASAVAAASGAAANAKFEHGVKVITLTRGGLMYEASIGGQKFGYRAY